MTCKCEHGCPGESPILTPGGTEADDAAYLRDLSSRLHLAIHQYRGVEDESGRLVVGDDDQMRLADIAKRLASIPVSGSTDALIGEARAMVTDLLMKESSFAEHKVTMMILRLSDSLAYSRRDSERLDWLQANPLDHAWLAMAAVHKVDLRAAIDAALSKSPPTEKDG
jgi:hypothetical protein